MKICQYCGCAVEDGAVTCPHCNAMRFDSACGRCGAKLVDGVCPVCAEQERLRQKREAEVRANAEYEERVAKANSGLVWKGLLTFFLPMIGGYFLIKDEVKPVVRYIALGWCLICPVIGVANSNLSFDFAMAIVVVIFIAPVLRYAIVKLMKSRKPK